jgi:hypothetical protein
VVFLQPQHSLIILSLSCLAYLLVPAQKSSTQTFRWVWLCFYCYNITSMLGVLSTSTLKNKPSICFPLNLSRPDVCYHCDVNFNPFAYLHENNMTYGLFTSLLAYGLSNTSLSSQGLPLRCMRYDEPSSCCGLLWKVQFPPSYNTLICTHIVSLS